ncbi:hypothetical protein FOZ63_013397, partial [Perkinsus olseni]
MAAVLCMTRAYRLDPREYNLKLVSYFSGIIRPITVDPGGEEFTRLVAELRTEVDSRRTRHRGRQQQSARESLHRSLEELDEQIQQLRKKPMRTAEKGIHLVRTTCVSCWLSASVLLFVTLTRLVTVLGHGIEYFVGGSSLENWYSTHDSLNDENITTRPPRNLPDSGELL